RRRVGLGEQHHPTGAVRDLLLELAASRVLGRLALDVSLPGRGLEDLAARGSPVLAHEQHVAVVGDRDDRHRAGMTDDRAGEGLAVVTLDGRLDELEEAASGSRRRADDAETGHDRTGGTSFDVSVSVAVMDVSIGSRGARPSARSAAARTNAP